MLPHQFRQLMELLRVQFAASNEAIREQTHANAEQQVANRKEIGKVSRSLRIITQGLQAKDQKDDSFYDKSYGQQERLLKSQKWLVIWAGCAFFAAFGYGAVAFWQGLLMRDSVRQSKVFFEQQNRPWVGPDSPILLSIVEDNSLGKIEYQTTIKNFGPSPAFNVIPEVDFVIGARGTDIRPEIDRVCQHLERDLLPIPLGVGEVMFPSGTYEFPSEAYIQASRKIDQVIMPKSDPVYFFPGCIVYKDGGAIIHHTGVCQWTDSAGLKAGTKLSSCSRQYAD